MNSKIPKAFKISNTQNIKVPATLFRSNSDIDNAVPHVVNTFLSSFNAVSITTFLEATKDENTEKPFSLLILYPSHAVQVGFDGTYWLSVNHDRTTYGDDIDEAVENVLPAKYCYNDLWIATIEVLSSDGEITIPPNLIIHNQLNLEPDNKIQNLISINLAFKNDYIETLTAFAKQILDSDLASSDKVELLAAKNSEGTSRLHYGGVGSVIAFTKQILESNLAQPDKIELLAAKTADGTPLLYKWLQRNQKEKLIAFTELILESNLEQSAKFDLLAAKTADGTWGPIRARLVAHVEGNTEVIDAFDKVVNDSTLAQYLKDRLLEL